MFTEAYINGWLAHRDSCRAEENPYNVSTQAHSAAQWETGWYARENRAPPERTFLDVMFA